MPDHVNYAVRIELEPFAEEEKLAGRQAIRVSRMVNREAELLTADHPGTLARYSWPYDAQRNIRRLAASEMLGAYIIHAGSMAAVGLATVIRSQHIIHPVEGKIVGDDVDYWLATNQPPRVHLAVVEKLCEGQEGRASFATVVRGTIQAKRKRAAFREHMIQTGKPAGLGHYGQDHYEVARDGAISQVYQLLLAQT